MMGALATRVSPLRAAAADGAVRRIVIGAPPGGSWDKLAREVAERLTRLSAPSSFIVENRPGGASLVATRAVAEAPPDGKTLFLGLIDSLALTPIFAPESNYEPLRELRLLAGIARVEHVLVANAALPVRSIADMVALGRSRGETGITYASPGSTSKLIFGALGSAYGIKVIDVAYRGVAQALPDLLTGRVDMAQLDSVTALIHANAGAINVVARVCGGAGGPLSAIHTLEEQGARGLSVDARFVLMGPNGLGAETIDPLRILTDRLKADPDFRSWLRRNGFEVLPESSEELATLVAGDAKRYRELAKKAGLQ
jgi:tripartite-type tricarboxylate transporter receptor subunit TctC